MGPEEKPELKRGSHGASAAAAMVGELWCGQSASESLGERERERADARALGRSYLEAQGAGRRVAMERACGVHARRPHGISSNTWCA